MVSRGALRLFIHWGVYAVPAGFWQGKPTGAEWIMFQGKIPVADYRAFAQQFHRREIQSQAWAQLAADAGINTSSSPRNTTTGRAVRFGFPTGTPSRPRGPSAT